MSKHCPACNSDELAKIKGEWVECPGIEVDEWHPASEPPKPEDFDPTGYVQLWYGAADMLWHGDYDGILTDDVRQITHWRKITPPK